MKNKKVFKNKVGHLFLLLVFFNGCGGEESELPKVYPVTGKISFEGKEIKNAVVELYTMKNNDLANKQNLPRPKGYVKADGTFFITTYYSGDGAPVGEYAVTISWKGDLKDFDEDEEDIDKLPELIPWEYTVPLQTKIRVSVKEWENVIPDINIRS